MHLVCTSCNLAGSNMTALDVTRLGQRQRGSSVASLLLVRGAGRWNFKRGHSGAESDVDRHEEDGYGTGVGRERRRNRGSSGRTERAGER